MAIGNYGSVLPGGSSWPHTVLILSTVQATLLIPTTRVGLTLVMAFYQTCTRELYSRDQERQIGSWSCSRKTRFCLLLQTGA